MAAKKKKTVVTEREVRLARAFLAAIHGNQTNGYLLLAVIAWQRAMAKAKDPYWKSLSRLSALAAGKRLAYRLQSRINRAPKQYEGVLAALRRVPYSDSGNVGQARDFMLAIELSTYDKHHYGYKPAVAGHWETTRRHVGGEGWVESTVWVPDSPEKDPLAETWATLTGHPIPPKWFTDVVHPKQAPPAKPPMPAQPRPLVHVRPRADYIHPYAAERFYSERPHLGDNVLPAD